jgi:DNA-directed RNA polymerase specialized sigma24 family protein
VLADTIIRFIRGHCSESEQEIFILRHYHQMNLTDIAEATNQSLTNVHRVLAVLTQRVKERFSGLAG